METSNTGKKQAGTFTKGDPRINRKGRPKSFDQLRNMAQSMANETAKDKNGVLIERNGHVVTQAEMILLNMMRENPEKFIEIAFGKVPQPVEHSGPDGGPIVMQWPEDKPNE